MQCQAHAGAPDPGDNLLLAALTDAERHRWKPHLELVELPLGTVISEPAADTSHVYFPTTVIVSLLYVMESGATSEIAVVGNEGLVGVSLFMGGRSTSSSAVVRAAGRAYRLSAALLMDEFNRNGPVLQLLLRYTQALITQMAQTSACNRHHAVHQQFCRWLLLTLDRQDASDIMMTHEMLSNILGVRRASVSEVAGKLQKDGLIRYERGRITVLDRPGLERRSCECYSVVKKEYDRLLPVVPGTLPVPQLGVIPTAGPLRVASRTVAVG